MIRAVIFDIGGVLVHSVDPLRQHYWEERCQITPGFLAVDFYINPVAQRALLGQASEAEVWSDFMLRHGLSLLETQTLQADWERARILDLDLLAFIGSLRPRYKTGIISDAFPQARLKMQAAFEEHGLDFQTMFDTALFSAEEGVCKPGPEIFQRALERLEILPGEGIFVDDVLKNVQGARQVGMQSLQFQGTDSKDLILTIQDMLQTQESQRVSS